MCGIAGSLGPPGEITEHTAIAVRMGTTLAHRGPDDSGEWVDPTGEATLSFRRLAILDLTPEGHQPMCSADGRFVVVFNGEIYNFATLRDELAATGSSFRGTSDTEVLLAAISAWGIEIALTRISGMCGLAIWDTRERILHLVRDRLGKKPVYYAWQGDTFLFGSELKALRAHPSFDAPLDRDALASYMRFSYVPAPSTIYAGVQKLPPASHITVRPDRPGEVTGPRLYWDAVGQARAGQRNLLDLSDEEATSALEELLSDAVGLRMVADVPLGAFLSGGIDSSTVVALMQARGPGKVRTFTIGFAAAEYDESAHAKTVAGHLGTDHTELRVTPEETRAVIPRLATMYDEPFADVSQIPTFLISELARRHVTVALSGDGGDEVFGGYNRYLTGARLASQISAIPRVVRSGIANLVEAVPPKSWDRVGHLFDRIAPRSRRGLISGNRVHKLATVLDVNGIDAMYERLVSTWPDPSELVRGGVEARRVSLVAGAQLSEPSHRMMLADLLGYLPDDILVKVDRASMSTSLEARAPLLDHRVVEFAWRLPLHQKIRNGEGKWLLRRVLERHLPRAMTERPKRGFGVPIDSWLRGPLREWAQDLLSEERIKREGFLNPGPVQAALRDHLRGRRNLQYQLWTVLMFESWLDQQATDRRCQ